MSRIPGIIPVTIKTEPIRQGLIDPGSMGGYFPPEVGPRIVYLDPQFSYPAAASADAQGERQRQEQIWRELGEAGVTQFLDRQVEEDISIARVWGVRAGIYEELGTRYSAEFYERVFAELLGTPMNVVAISTGIRPFDGNNYHDIGYLRK